MPHFPNLEILFLKKVVNTLCVSLYFSSEKLVAASRSGGSKAVLGEGVRMQVVQMLVWVLLCCYGVRACVVEGSVTVED